MKKALKRSLSFLLAVAIIFSSAYVGLGELDFSGFFAVRAKAANEEYLKFTISDNNAYYYLSECDPLAEGEVVIPSTYNGLPVKIVGAYSFEKCSLITSVVIPDSVTEIRNHAFYKCSRLESVNIPNKVTKLWTEVFAECTSLKSIVIPDSVTWTN